MASPNINLRDPALYRIKRATHHNTGDTWCIYPMYTYAHPIEDALEQITHSICTLEFEDQRPFYDWLLDTLCGLGLLAQPRPHQYEFARLNVTHVITSKRKLKALVDDRIVDGWDDPRMPTIAGLRRRGYTPEAVRDFCTRIGVAKKENVVDVALLEHTVREDLNRRAQRGLAVLRPLKVQIENYGESEVEYVEAVNNPEDPAAGVRKIPFSPVLYIEADDFMMEPPKKFFRLSPGSEVRLRYAYILKCERVVTDESGVPTELRCTIDTGSLDGPTSSRRVKGTLHWVSAAHAVDAEIRLYDRLFRSEDPGDNGRDPLADLNPESLNVLTGCKVEPMLAGAPAGTRFQFERQGYFCVDPDSVPGAPVFNRTVTLKDTWAKISRKSAS